MSSGNTVPQEKSEAELVYEFFSCFSRMEFALKVKGYLTAQNGDAKPNWDSFADSFESKYQTLQKDEVLLKAIQYIQSAPPQKQIVDNGKLTWTAGLNSSDDRSCLKWLLLMVRRVRNNLFHGGKFAEKRNRNEGDWKKSRNYALLQHSITILNFCAENVVTTEMNEIYIHAEL